MSRKNRSSRKQNQPTADDALKVLARDKKSFVADGYQNVFAKLGINEQNLSSGGQYGFGGFLTRQRILLDAAYRTSWIIGQLVDVIAEDMIRAGITVDSTLKPEEIAILQESFVDKGVWSALTSAIKWGRLYGGAIAVIMIEGQKLDSPLDLDTIGRDSFKGLLIVDRWFLWPSLGDLVEDFGPNYGLPRFYQILETSTVLPAERVHYSRCIRFTGIELPYLWKLAENFWSESVIERVYDRLLAFDSTTQGVAQLVYKAHLRTVQIKDLREILAAGGVIEQALVKQFDYIRAMQTNEGITLLDSEDAFETHNYTFSGLDDVLLQFGQQLSGATGIPLVRLFGQSPKGMNATGEADLRNYYDNINKIQESHLKTPVKILLDIDCRSTLGKPLPIGSRPKFVPLWQLSDKEKSEIAGIVATSITGLFTSGIFSRAMALTELRQSSHVSGFFTNISDKDIQEAENEPPLGAGEGDIRSAVNAVKHPRDSSGHFARSGTGSPFKRESAAKPEGADA